MTSYINTLFTSRCVISLFFILIYKASIDVSIRNLALVYDGYPYYNIFGQIDHGKILIGYFLCIFAWLPLFSINLKERRFSFSILCIQYLLIVVPFISYFAVVDAPWLYLTYVLGCHLLVCILVLFFKYTISFPAPDKSLQNFLIFIFGLISVLTIAGLIVGGGLSRFNLNFYDVYDFRVKEFGFPLSDYLVTWSAYVINPFLIIIFMIKRNKFGVLFFIILQLSFFPLTSHKSFLLVGLVIIGIYLLSRRFFLPNILIIIFISGILASWIIIFMGQPIGYSLLDRLVSVPAALHSLYFEYFSTHPLSFLSGTKFSLHISDYDLNTVELVAYGYWGRLFSPNVGWMGDAFANFGVPGLIIYSVILSVLLWIGDSLSRNITKPGLIEATMFASAVSLCSSALQTVFLTSGLFITFISTWILSGLAAERDTHD